LGSPTGPFPAITGEQINGNNGKGELQAQDDWLKINSLPPRVGLLGRIMRVQTVQMTPGKSDEGA